MEQILSKSPNIRYWFSAAWVVCLALGGPLFGQTLKLSSASASRGDQITLELTVESPAGKEPLALQWETKVPLLALTLLEEKGFVVADTLRHSKALSCASVENTAQSFVSRCILAGSQH